MIPKYWFLCLVIYLVTVSPLTGQDSSSHLQLPKSVYGFSLVETSALGGTAGTAYRYKGTAAVSVGQTRVPSQRELNGFLLGQHKDAIAASFAKVLQIDTTSDGWINRSYLLDRPHRAYMSFKFSHGRLDYATSVQVAGDSGTPMVPFVGIVLGSSRQALLERFGNPARVEHQNDVNTDLYTYEGSNYSFEIDAHGLVSSIQIFGEDGFDTLPAKPTPSLDSLAIALKGGREAALQYLAPDVEIYRGKRSVRFRHGALADLQADTSELSRALFQGPQSVASIVAPVRPDSDVYLGRRVCPDGGSGWVWKFPAPAAIAELVFKASAGRWRLWEVRYR